VAKCEVQGRRDAGREERGKKKKKKKKRHFKQTCTMCGGTWDQSGNIVAANGNEKMPRRTAHRKNFLFTFVPACLHD